MLVAGLLGCFATAACGGQGWSACGPAVSASEARIQAALGEDTHIEFIDTPLEEVVAFLRDMHDIPIEMDVRALDDVGLSPETPVTKNLRGISLGSALKLILEDLEMTFVVHNEVLLLTTKDAAPKHAVIRVYDVSKLIGDDADATRLCDAVSRVLHSSPPGGDGNAPAGSSPGGAFGYGGGYGSDDGEDDSEDYGGAGYGEESYGMGEEMSGYGMGGFPAAAASPAVAKRLPQITSFRHLLIVRDTTSGHQRFSQLLGAIARGLGCAED